MKRILLTGAAGTVGHHALKQLIEKKYEVTVLEIKSKKNEKRLKPYMKRIKLIWGSITNHSIVKQVIKDQDAVIHLAGLIPPYADFHPEFTREVNFFGTKNIIDAIKEINFNCFFMFSSSISVYGDRVKKKMIKVTDELKASEGDYYAYTKIETEKLIKESNINYSIFRLTAIMDVPGIDPLMFHMPLDTSLEIASARDTARAFVNGLEHQKELNGKIFNLGGGEKCRTTYRDFLKDCFTIYGLDYNDLDEKAFAERNFHCGYYADGDFLNNIVHFRQDTLTTYRAYLKANTSKLKYLFTRLFRKWIIFFLLKKSEPLKARKEKRIGEILRFFYK